MNREQFTVSLPNAAPAWPAGIEQDVRAYILERFLFGAERPLASDDSLIASHVIDSTGVVELITFLEERFGIEVRDLEVVPQNLDTIGRIVSFVAAKKSAGAR